MRATDVTPIASTRPLPSPEPVQASPLARETGDDIEVLLAHAREEGREEGREEERQRLSRRLHDDLGQRLAALQLDLGALRTQALVAGGAGWAEEIDRAGHRLAQAIAAVREVADEWRPVALDDIGLNEALDALARRSAQRMGIEVTLRCDEQAPPVTPRLAAVLYRCVQEALRNVAHHAQATDVAIEVFCDDAQVRLEVQDNGIGPPARPLPEAGALRGLAVRIRSLGGELRLDRTPGSGARLRVRVPADGARPGVAR